MTDPAADPKPRAAWRALSIQRHTPDGVISTEDQVAEETPVALVFNGISHAVMMATPEDLDLFALGFALSEGIVDEAAQIRSIEVIQHADSAEVQLEIAQSAFMGLKQQRRTLAGRTGCGVCGTESLELLDLAPEPLRVAASSVNPSPELIRSIVEALPAHQRISQATGCAHAAAWCSAQGEILQVFEDVGRHNAEDKLLGWLARQNIDSTQGLLFLTSRASYELVRKAARRQIPLMATISAPTALAIKIAHQAGIRLLSFCRKNGFVEY